MRVCWDLHYIIRFKDFELVSTYYKIEDFNAFYIHLTSNEGIS